VYELILLLRSELDHRPSFIGIAEGGEDLAIDAKVWMTMVCVLLAAGEAQHQPTELLKGHGCGPCFSLNNPMTFPSGSANQENCPVGIVMTGSNAVPPSATALSR